MPFFPGVGAKEGVSGPSTKKTFVSSEPKTNGSTSRRGMTGSRGKMAGSSTGPRSAVPQSRKNKANPFTTVVRKSG